MDVFTAIKNRRSCRSFVGQAIARETIEALVYHASLAPSPKNRQPWKVHLLQDRRKDDFVSHAYACLEKLKVAKARFGSLELSLRAMSESGALLVVYNPLLADVPTDERERWQRSDLQAIGAMIQTMLLSATALGLGSLWINDVYFIEDELKAWLDLEADIVAIVALGHVDELPYMKRRRAVHDIIISF